MDTRKTVGTTTLSASGGSVIGVAVATILFSVLPLEQSPAMFGAVGIVCSAIFAVGAGYLSPSKAATLAPYLDQAGEAIADKVAVKAPTAVVPSADEVAEAVANKTSTSGYTGTHAATGDVERHRPTEAPTATEPGLGVQAVAAPAGTSDDAYPDLDSLAKVGTV